MARIEDDDEEASETTDDTSLGAEAGFLLVGRHILDLVLGTLFKRWRIQCGRIRWDEIMVNGNCEINQKSYVNYWLLQRARELSEIAMM